MQLDFRLLKYVHPSAQLRLIANFLGVEVASLQSVDVILAKAYESYPFLSPDGDRPWTIAEAIRRTIDGGLTAIPKEAKEIIATPQGRRMVTKEIFHLVETTPEASGFVDVLSKLSHAPIVGFGDVEHTDAYDFVENGVLPLLADIRKTEVDENNIKCPACNTVTPVTAAEREVNAVVCNGCCATLKLRKE